MKFRKDVIETETVVMRSVTGTVRYIRASTGNSKNSTSIEGTAMAGNILIRPVGEDEREA